MKREKLRALAEECLNASWGHAVLDDAIVAALAPEVHIIHPSQNLAMTKALIKDRLPGWAYAFGERYDYAYALVNNGMMATIGISGTIPNPAYRWHEKRAATPELAGCAALLLAIAEDLP